MLQTFGTSFKPLYDSINDIISVPYASGPSIMPYSKKFYQGDARIKRVIDEAKKFKDYLVENLDADLYKASYLTFYKGIISNTFTDNELPQGLGEKKKNTINTLRRLLKDAPIEITEMGALQAVLEIVSKRANISQSDRDILKLYLPILVEYYRLLSYDCVEQLGTEVIALDRIQNDANDALKDVESLATGDQDSALVRASIVTNSLDDAIPELFNSIRTKAIIERNDLTKAFQAEAEHTRLAEKYEGERDVIKQQLSHERQLQALQDNVALAQVKFLKPVIEKQSKLLNALQNVHIQLSNKRTKDVTKNMAQMTLNNVDSSVWKEEANGLVSYLKSETDAFVSNIRLGIIAGSHANEKMAEIQQDMRSRLLSGVHLMHNKLDTLLNDLESQQMITQTYSPHVSCVPLEHRIATTAINHGCWKRTTEKRYLKLAFANCVGNEINIKCCRKHMEALERIREVCIINYIMTRTSNGEMIWDVKVVNGF